jgi:peptide subunit release factor RF-3
MAVDREVGVSVPSVVMSFEQEGLGFDQLDISGHQDFGEDTLWTVTT